MAIAWAEVCLSVTRERAVEVEEALLLAGALAVTLLDDADQAVFEPAVGTAPLWPMVRISGLFPGATNRVETTLSLMADAGLERPEDLTWRDVADQDWQRAWMDRFQPMQFGQRLWIVPSGMEAPADADAILLRLDPGLAFGTGTHPTTSLCLQWIDGQELSGCKVVDYGCGSGVLGIACAMKGAERVVCVDNDPQALEATLANAARNNVSKQIICQAPEAFRDSHVDVMIANILAGPLIELAPRLQASVRVGGHIVLSGILDEQSEAVASAYEEKCSSMHIRSQEGWVRLHGIAG